jgi:hypothetical protein
MPAQHKYHSRHQTEEHEKASEVYRVGLSEGVLDGEPGGSHSVVPV